MCVCVCVCVCVYGFGNLIWFGLGEVLKVGILYLRGRLEKFGALCLGYKLGVKFDATL